MVVIVRDRVQDLVAKKMTLEQIKAAKPSRDYDAEMRASPRRRGSVRRIDLPEPDRCKAGRRKVVRT